MKKSITIIILSILSLQMVVAQDVNWKSDRKLAVLFGLTQPLLVSGFNIEGNLIYNRFIFDYSHGASLNFSSDLVTEDLKTQGVVVKIPWTTGFGIGYRFTDWINLRVEPKWHRFEYYYDGESQNEQNRIAANNTFSLGLGLYGFFQPFKNQDNILKGITIAPSIRFWPTLNASFEDNRFSYSNKRTNTSEELKTNDSGVGFTPLIINVSVGYSFHLKKTK